MYLTHGMVLLSLCSHPPDVFCGCTLQDLLRVLAIATSDPRLERVDQSKLFALTGVERQAQLRGPLDFDQ